MKYEVEKIENTYINKNTDVEIFSVILSAVLILLIILGTLIYRNNTISIDVNANAEISTNIITEENAEKPQDTITNVTPSDKTEENNTVIPSNPSNPSTPSTPTNPTNPEPTPTPPARQPEEKDVSEMTKEEITEKMIEAINQLKSESNMKAEMSEAIDVKVVDLSVPSAIDMVNNVVKSVVGDENETMSYNFVNGKATDSDGKTVTPFSVIPPLAKNFAITYEGVASATATKVGNNTVYSIILAPEQTTLNNPIPSHNSSTIGFLDLASLDLPSVTITTADMYYPGSTVEITVNENNKVVKLVNKMPMTGKGEAKITFISGFASFEGSLNEVWNFTY